ncbi:MAG: hypothetical protein GX166_04075 [Clostridiaceae bacterium]|nr:hypothetical protein [Clostridiaceae bacterium]
MLFTALIPVCALPTQTPAPASGEANEMIVVAILIVVFFLLGFALGYAFKYKTGCRKKRKYNYMT